MPGSTYTGGNVPGYYYRETLTKTGPNSYRIVVGARSEFMTAQDLERQARRNAEFSRMMLLEIAAQQAISSTATERSSNSGGSILTQAMAAMAVGDRVPVVFARRRSGGTGGVLVQPKATEMQVSNTATNITIRWHCIISDGRISSVEVRDVRNGLSRQGTFSQNYDQRAGSWLPGNRTRKLPSVELPAFPLQTGTGGTYSGLSTIEFSNSYPINSERWKQSWSVFCRGGLIISRGRLVDDVVGPSDNLCDLIVWALPKSGLVTIDQIDLDAMETAAKFLDVNELFCNAEFKEAQTIPDFLTGILPSFLLRETTIDGKYAVVPLLPINADGTLNVDTLIPDLIITENLIVPGSFSQQPAPSSSRGPLRILATYRQQTSETEPPLLCSLPLGSAVDASPAEEEFQLDGFCTSRLHAATAAGYRHAVRTLAGGTAAVELLPGWNTGSLMPGWIVKTVFRVESEVEEAWLEGWWQVVRVELSGDGNSAVVLSELPVDGQGRSIISQQVVAARALAGDLEYPYPVISDEDEAGRDTDTTVPTSTTITGTIDDRGGASSGGGGVSLPPPNQPAGPTPSGGDPFDGGGGGVVDGAGDGTRDKDDRRQPPRKPSDPRWPPPKCARDEATSQALIISYMKGSTKIVLAKYGPVDAGPGYYFQSQYASFGTIIVTTEKELFNQTTTLAPVPLTYREYKVWFAPCAFYPDGSISHIGPYESQGLWVHYSGGPFYDGEIRTPLDFDFQDLGCRKQIRTQDGWPPP